MNNVVLTASTVAMTNVVPAANVLPFEYFHYGTFGSLRVVWEGGVSR